ncbi:unnamed protein product [Mycena citricolor]|uniref:SAM domain-containing protein n=1 Tax=Mycena citricolor TaxID=2018698 RepID=A0AAD2H0S7_9AGAR|nr:unnamed protein product [Mycena citricolor]CAK5281343.1 unnamed protein product [Mycena citricolor]
MTALPSPKPQFASAASRLPPLLSPRPGINGFTIPPSPRFPKSPGGKGEGERLDQWFEDLSKYEATVAAMAEASTDAKFHEELGTIEQWFAVLSEAERTATLYTLLQHSNQNQIRFLIAVLQQMAGPAPLTASLDGSFKAKQQQKPSGRNLRPPTLNIPVPEAPAAPAPVSAAPPEPTGPGQDVVFNRPADASWANMVNTPFTPMFQKPAPAQNQQPVAAMPGLNPMMVPPGMINPMQLNNMALSNEAQLNQLLAMQMMLNGMMQQPGGMPQPGMMQPPPPAAKSGKGSNWRQQGNARHTGNAARGGSSKGSGHGGQSASSSAPGNSNREDDVDPELLKDVPAWLRSLRLHKYTVCFAGMTWEDMVALDDSALEVKGVAALGARRRLLKTFQSVKVKMGMAPAPDSDPVSAGAVSASEPSP